MPFLPPPATAAWRHRDARSGFEVVYFQAVTAAGSAGGQRAVGCTTAVEDGATWVVDYAIEVDAGWRTRRAHVTCRSATGVRSVLLEADGQGHWLVDGATAAHLDGCLDVDLESSAMTNAFPVHRRELARGEPDASPAAYVRAGDAAVERLEQSYVRLPDDDGQRYAYACPRFDTFCELRYDAFGLVLEYPGIASRVG